MNGKYNQTGLDIICDKLEAGEKDEIVEEIKKIEGDIVEHLKVKGGGSYYLKEIYGNWEGLHRGEKIKLGKRMKTYESWGLLTQIELDGKASNGSMKYRLEDKQEKIR